jgi:hypothetical protein
VFRVVVCYFAWQQLTRSLHLLPIVFTPALLGDIYANELFYIMDAYDVIVNQPVVIDNVSLYVS